MARRTKSDNGNSQDDREIQAPEKVVNLDVFPEVTDKRPDAEILEKLPGEIDAEMNRHMK